MEKWNKLADSKTIEKTIAALKSNGINAFIVGNSQDAMKKVFEILPKGVEVMTVSSTTLDSIGASKEINESGNYNSVRNKLISMNRNTQGLEMKKLGAAPEWVVGSVHAVTEDGKVVIASNSGSQIPAYAYGAEKVVWVVGAQKIVENLDEGIKRIYEYSLPLESERVKKVYGMPSSSVNKLLIINKEGTPGRTNLIIVKENIGF